MLHRLKSAIYGLVEQQGGVGTDTFGMFAYQEKPIGQKPHLACLAGRKGEND